ncbi:glycosyltransferase [Flexivirga sp. ID2601S]|uniref:Glycosyltransferase n=1 Tax=Flexivirga aerilata TaxID=1656889 RepID=A0A849AMM7_9MICO|nr:glycosyltransferase [Flexivirga aerilata]NNG41037.1 glycosyltransferase [Flexivirga aerilata]
MTTTGDQVSRGGEEERRAGRVTVVLLTYNCARWIERTVRHLKALGVPILAVDNASDDNTVALLHRNGVRVIELPANRGAAGRNVGAEAADTPYVAFCDDDGWFERDGLDHAVDLLEQHPRLAVVNARILVNDEQRLDPISREMASSPLRGDPRLPGTVLLGFMAGAVVVRRAAFLEVGGYDPRFFIGGEEETLAVPLLRNGWQLRYVPEVVAHHYPSGANAAGIRHLGVRNTVTNAWLHRPARRALSWTIFIARTTRSRRTLLRGLVMVLLDLPWIVRERSVMPDDLDRALAILERRRRAATPSRSRRPGAVW